ncbi:hypothetical protein [Paenibacillus sp. FJAT-26967]|uniref:hypothetical protein n=1 Tax=Paenibacillus sp. FJAT-26967 TaxID=1729690 RepID=UPI000838AAE7|nr:hypothetical protein [Paenibacillus sp. FJAT-26967]
MSREGSYMQILQSAAQMQVSIASILESKAAEAEKSRAWITHHLNAAHFASHTDQVQQPLEIHEGLLELIDAMTKMEQALGRHLQILVGEADNENGGGLGQFQGFDGGAMG